MHWKIVVPRGTFEMNMYDIIVIGGGHAGVEACHIASKFKLKVALITLESVPIGSAPCNPSIGGIGKGQVAREIDCMGGLMGKLADSAGIQYRILNESKGYAVQSTRVQIDKDLYAINAEESIKLIPNIDIIKEKVISIDKVNDFKVITEKNEYISKKLILTVGTFLNGKLHMGKETFEGGRIDSENSEGLEDIFSNIKIRNIRFKTGTPPRILKRSIDFSKLIEQKSDPKAINFHLLNDNQRKIDQLSCYLTHTNQKTIDIISENKELSPMYNGQIEGTGARYCPSIEDKVFRYPEKSNHHIFVEPEGLNTDLYYPSGISSSLPKKIQDEFIKTINGLENSEISKYGYAVEYDVIDTTYLNSGLEHSEIPGLHFAGQVNGTSGYEEAAGQGLIAGIYASMVLSGQDPIKLSREDSYIGVMIQDLITNTRDEPYRLFTSRSENRLSIREDNCHLRMKKYRDLLNINDEFDEYLNILEDEFLCLSKFCDETSVSLDNISKYNDELAKVFKKLEKKIFISDILKVPTVDPVDFLNYITNQCKISFNFRSIRTAAISKKYEGYIKKHDVYTRKIQKVDRMNIDLNKMLNSSNISFECKQRIKKSRPETFKDLKNINGIRQATLAVVASGVY